MMLPRIPRQVRELLRGVVQLRVAHFSAEPPPVPEQEMIGIQQELGRPVLVRSEKRIQKYDSPEGPEVGGRRLFFADLFLADLLFTDRSVLEPVEK